MEFHLFLPQMRMSMDDIVKRARGAEAAGFGGIALIDHLAPPAALNQPMYEAMTTATWLAAHTERLTISHLVLCDYMRHPAVLAKQAVTLDHCSGGRFELGIGWGSVPEELESYGVGDRKAATRVARLAETLDVLRLLWSGDTVSYDGQFHHLAEVSTLPVPLTRIPIVIGGAGPRTLRLVAEHADWWNLALNQLNEIERMRPSAGSARISVQQMITLIASEEQREEVTAQAERRFGRMGANGGRVTGNPDELVAYFKGLADRGVERVYAWFTDFASASTLEAFRHVVEQS